MELTLNVNFMSASVSTAHESNGPFLELVVQLGRLASNRLKMRQGYVIYGKAELENVFGELHQCMLGEIM